MKPVLCFAILLTFAATTLPALCQEETTQQLDSFFQSIQEGDVSTAYETLFADAGIPDTVSQEKELYITDTELYSGTYGDVLGWEQIVSQKLGNSLLRYVYLLKWEKHPTVFEFYFYKPEKEWFLCDMTMTHDFSLLSEI